MSRNLIVNGGYDASRSGASKYGTFWSAVQPPFPTSLIDAISNPSFEVNTTGWTGTGNHSISRITSDANFGTACLQIVASAIGDSSTNHAKVTTTVTTGVSYTTRFYAKSVSGNTTLTVRDETNNGSGTFTLTASWALYSISITHNTSSNSLRFFLGGAGTFLIDNVSEKTAGTDGTYTLDIGWGERLAENSGRVRGLSGVGTIPATTTPGTSTITFPTSYFAHTPIVDLFLPRSYILDGQSETFDDKGSPVVRLNTLFGDYIVNDPYSVEYYYVNPAWNDFIPDNVSYPNQPPWILARQIGSNGFLVTNITRRNFARTYWNIPVPFYWHAFGV